MKPSQSASRVTSPGRRGEAPRADARPISARRRSGSRGRHADSRGLLAWGLGGLLVLELAGLLALCCLGLGTRLAGEQGGAPGSARGQTGQPAPDFSLRYPD